MAAEHAGAAEHAAAAVPGCSEPPSKTYDAALVDLDGVVYVGGAAVPGAPGALEQARALGMRLVFVTNNASRTPRAVGAHLTALGVPARAEDVVTSGQAAAGLLAERLPPGAAVLVAGSTALRAAVRERGLRPVSVASDRPAAVVQGYAPDMSYSLLAEAALAVRDGAWFVASNGDVTLPTARGRQPGNGALSQVVATATGQQPVIAGKPERPLHAEAVSRSAARRPLVVGDRLDTDIEGAVRSHTDSLLVFTGVTRPLDAVLAPAHRRPTYLAEDLTGLLSPHPPVTSGEDRFRCGGFSARWDAGAGRFTLEGDGDRMDGLRALCAAAWSAEAVTADQVGHALEALGWPVTGDRRRRPGG